MAINSITDLWERICEDCKETEKISEIGLKSWIVDLVPISTDDGVLTLATRNIYI